ncbi:amidohydrolase family protein [Sphingomonas sp. So64.6b]|uniref:N-acyl-D-amino-acid deacylase family protein n=1 Tax=Sphingomonas sp. So64.6b TaxID=2997354 RepID=UPI001602DBC5|nr:amidohydrolase family protein [Sphingomonas sp. So64.6b]QNA86583.1 amidohydrolase family protein [Sphingomonas sp. So64.6b]
MSQRLTRRLLIGGAMATGGLASWPARAAALAERSTLFREVLLVDGTGAAPRLADILLTGDRIARITPPAASGLGSAARVIAGEGRILAPGFIDTHSHGDPLKESFESFLAMGVTTIVLGQDGDGPRIRKDLDPRSWMNAIDRVRLDVNVALLASHGTLRRAAGVSDAVRHLDSAALERMAAQLEIELRAGAFGLSYGLEYVPGIYSETAELTNLGRVVSRHGGVVMSHMRSENDDEIEASIDELITSSLPARPHISHLKVVFGKGEQRARELLASLAAKRRQGIDLTADEYPYTAGYTGIDLLFPQWALPPTDYASVVATRRQELRDHLEKRMIRRGGPEALLLGSKPYAGKTVAQASQEAGLHFADFLIKLGPEGGSGAHFTMDKALQDTLILDPFVAISTDGRPGMRHPRATGTYAKWIEEYVVRDRKLPIEEAVRKATAFPAGIMRFADRGVIRVGAKADLILFDPAKVKARSTYVDPFAMAEGFDLVMVNGRAAFAGGKRVGFPGRLLRAG